MTWDEMAVVIVAAGEYKPGRKYLDLALKSTCGSMQTIVVDNDPLGSNGPPTKEADSLNTHLWTQVNLHHVMGNLLGLAAAIKSDARYALLMHDDMVLLDKREVCRFVSELSNRGKHAGTWMGNHGGDDYWPNWFNFGVVDLDWLRVTPEFFRSVFRETEHVRNVTDGNHFAAYFLSSLFRDMQLFTDETTDCGSVVHHIGHGTQDGGALQNSRWNPAHHDDYTYFNNRPGVRLATVLAVYQVWLEHVSGPTLAKESITPEK